MAITYNPRIVTDGLVLCLDAGNTKSYPGSGTTWTDLSGNGNTGTLTNGPTFNSANGGSIGFDATNDYIALPNVTSITDNYKNNTAFTLDCFVRKSSIINNSPPDYNLGFMLFQNNDGGWTPGWSIYIRNAVSNNNDVHFQIGYSSTNDAIRHICPYGLIDDTWAHVAITHSIASLNSTCKFYLNGQLLNTFTSTATALSTSGNLSNVIGRHPNVSYQGHNSEGRIASYKLYNRALSAAEVQQNFNATRGRFGI